MSMPSLRREKSRVLRTVLAGVLSLLAVATLSGAASERVMRRSALDAFPVVGKLVRVDGDRRIQIDCRGAGSPTVVLESGLDNLGSLSWASVHDSLAQTTRVCAYSRAGIMWSDPASAAFDSRTAASDLHAALAAAGERAPYVMAGHSVGGPYVVTFTARYPSEVKGLVLVDPSHPDQFARYLAATGKSLLPPAALIRAAASLSWTGALRLLPPDSHPTWPRAAMDGPAAFLPRSLSAGGQELAAIPSTLATARTAHDLGDRPFVVLSAAGRHPDAELDQMGLTRAQGDRLEDAQHALHADMATWSRRGRRELVPNSSHYIQFDRPEVVIRAIREVVAAVRQP